MRGLLFRQRSVAVLIHLIFLCMLVLVHPSLLCFSDDLSTLLLKCELPPSCRLLDRKCIVRAIAFRATIALLRATCACYMTISRSKRKVVCV